MAPIEALNAIRTELGRRETDSDLAASRVRCQSLRAFVEEAWHVVEPVQPFTPGWHIDAICEHLEAVTDGRITRLAINVPPGSTKSLIVSVLWPAWEWGPRGLPHLRYLTTSYEKELVLRDNDRMRDVIESDWYKARWAVRIRRRMNAKGTFANTASGIRKGRPFNSLTGWRGDRVVIDDPHSVKQAESEQERQNTTETFRLAVPHRLNNPKTSAIVLVMQRLHAKDVCGVIKSLGLDYVWLVIPMEYEPPSLCPKCGGVLPEKDDTNPCPHPEPTEDRMRPRNALGWRDPRTQPGELMCPARWPLEVIAGDKRVLGPYGWAGQMQQRPAPKGGGMFKRAWFPIEDAPAAGIRRWVRGWDLAATQDGGDYTRGVRVGGPDVNGRYCVLNVVGGQLSDTNRDRLIKSTTTQDGHVVEVDLPQDPGQAGKSQIRALVAMLAGYVVWYSPESGDKAVRAGPFASQAGAGNVYLVRGPWNAEWLDEHEAFDAGEFDDQVDATSRAFNRLTAQKANTKITPPSVIQQEEPEG